MSSPIPLTVKSSLTENLRDEILIGKLVPGQHLRLEVIADRFNVSTMPVREALRDLEAEGLVTIYPHKRAIVTKLSPSDLEDIYDIRAVLEAMATRLAVPKLTEEDYSELSNIIEQIDSHKGELLAIVQLNHDFHSTIYQASGRRHLIEIIKNLRYRTQHYLRAFISDLGGLPLAQEEHRVLIKACKDGEDEHAASIIFQHVRNVGQSIVDFVSQQEDGQEKEV